jgi:hypothetical protein
MFKKNDIIEVHMNESIDFNIKVKKNDINFNIILKESCSRTKDEPERFVWFVHVELPRTKQYRLCAYGTKKFFDYTQCQEEAFIYLNNLPNAFFQTIKDL